MKPSLDPAEVGRYAHEHGILHVLAVPGATQDQLRTWVEACWPGALTRLKPASPKSADLTVRRLEAWVHLDGPRMLLVFGHHEAGFLHDVAMKAAEAGVHSLVVDGESFYGPAPYFAFTQHGPGHEPETRWFDPLRGALTEPVPAEWLAKYLGFEGEAEDFAVDFGWLGGEVVVSFVAMMKGKLLAAPYWYGPDDDVPQVQDEAALLAASSSDSVLTAVKAIIGLVLLTPFALGVPVLLFLLGDVRNDVGAAITAGASLLCVGWLGLLPLRWPTGRTIALGWRLLWFLGLPVLTPFSMWLGGG